MSRFRDIVEPLGGTVEWTRGNHIRVYLRDHVIIASGTPSDYRSMRDFKARVRRALRD